MAAKGATMKAVVGHHVDRKFKVDIDLNKRRKFLKLSVVDELNDDEFEEIYHEEDYHFGQHDLKEVYETFTQAMNIGTPNVFRVFEENGLCKILIAKAEDIELPPFTLRPVSGPCVQKYQQFRRAQRKAKQQQDNDDDSQPDDEKEKEQQANKNVFQNKLPLAQPKPLNKK